jgi:glycosyl-4,4'-diaponeurosporenoate acyltransferase
MIDLHPQTALLLNVVAWPIWSIAVGYWGHRRANASFVSDRWWSRLRPFEGDAEWYQRALRIKAWKDVMPEAGGFFPGGFVKRYVCRDRGHLERFVIETRRAEWVHWIIFLLWPVFALWNPPWAVMVMLIYATAANLPCIVIQRYNRARLLRVLPLSRPARSSKAEAARPLQSDPACR